MAHRDGLPRFSALSVRCGDAGHRKACATPSASLGKPPLRSRMRSVGGRRKVLTMHRIACNFPPARRAAYAISMSHDQRSLVLTQWSIISVLPRQSANGHPRRPGVLIRWSAAAGRTSATKRASPASRPGPPAGAISGPPRRRRWRRRTSWCPGKWGKREGRSGPSCGIPWGPPACRHPPADAPGAAMV